MKHLKKFESFLVEEKRIADVNDADEFIRSVLKMGSKDNLFDKFLKKKDINPDELSSFVSLVADRIKENWT